MPKRFSNESHCINVMKVLNLTSPLYLLLFSILSISLAHVIEDKSLDAWLSVTTGDEGQLHKSGVTIDPSKNARKLWPNKEIIYCLNRINHVSDLQITRKAVEEAWRLWTNSGIDGSIFKFREGTQDKECKDPKLATQALWIFVGGGFHATYGKGADRNVISVMTDDSDGPIHISIAHEIGQ